MSKIMEICKGLIYIIWLFQSLAYFKAKARLKKAFFNPLHISRLLLIPIEPKSQKALIYGYKKLIYVFIYQYHINEWIEPISAHIWTSICLTKTRVLGLSGFVSSTQLGSDSNPSEPLWVDLSTYSIPMA
jgi:hypothetical protein